MKARIRTHLDLQRERKKSNQLLRVLLPDAVVHDLIQHGSHKPQIKENVSILFCDFVGFLGISSRLSPQDLIDELSDIFSAFDSLCETHGTTRIKTIGDAYMAVSGVHHSHHEHAHNLVRTALSFIDYLEQRNATAKQEWQCRIGIHSGKVIAGIIGKTRFIYDVVGDDVNIASRTESAGETMKVTITEATRTLIEKDFDVKSAGISHLKGKGEMELFHLCADIKQRSVFPSQTLRYWRVHCCGVCAKSQCGNDDYPRRKAELRSTAFGHSSHHML